ncbi:type VI secretion system baseplate subunit TssK [Pusillimonas noertemannii]|uniref:type VI secretion system baseplate subunit TssK n=1 Tax=Pusillimonas noertemannii TaxID=305977 RepID=UPI00333E84FC
MMEQKKVVWSEGMFLRPHHFQQQERYLEGQARIRSECVDGIAWGFRRLDLDDDALASGAVALKSATGVFPDGTPFSFSSASDAPPALQVPPEAQGRKILLAVARSRGGEQDVAFDDAPGSLARHDVTESELEDACDVNLEPAVLQLGRLRLRLAFEGEALGDWVTLGVARVAERRSDHRVVLDEAYVPPVLAVGAAAGLRSWLREVRTLLEARGAVLAQRMLQPGRGGVSELAEFLMLATVNRYYGLISHAAQIERSHPETLFREALMLAGELTTYDAGSRRFAQVPEYLHDDLAASFQPLLFTIRRALSAVVEDSAIQIVLEDRGQGVRVGQVNDPELLRSAGFLLAVHAELPADLLRTRFPAQAKLGPVERIRDLVHLQLPGIGLRPVASVPRQLPYHAGYLYFELEKSGDMWKQLERTGGLALHLAGEFPGLQLECWAVRG